MFKKYPKTKIVLLGLVLLLVMGWIIQVPPPWSPSLSDWFLENVESPKGEIPLRGDGSVDFLELINRQSRDTATVENNWAVHLLQIRAPDVPPAYVETWNRELGNPPVVEIPPLVFLGEVVAELVEGQAGPDADRLDEELYVLLERPWTSEEQPEVAEWLRSQQPALDYFTSGRHKTEWYYPIAIRSPGEPIFVAASFTHINDYRELAKTLVARAMNRLGEGKLEECLDDLAVIREMVSTIRGSRLFLIEELTMIATQGIGAGAESAALSHGTWSRELCDEYQSFIERKAEIGNNLANCMSGERLATFDLLQAMERNKLSNAEIGFPKIGFGMLGPFVYWPEVARTVNERYEELIAAANIADALDRKAKLDFIESGNLESPNAPLEFIKGARRRGRLLGNAISSELMPSIGALNGAVVRGQIQDALVVLGLELEKYRLENGDFPDALDELNAEFVARWATDLYTGQLLTYRRIPGGYFLYSLGPDRVDGLFNSEGVLIDETRGLEYSSESGIDEYARLRVVRD